MNVEVAGAKHPEASKANLRGFEINAAPAAPSIPAGFTEFYAPLHARFTPWQQELASKRKDVLKTSHSGGLPQYLPASEAITAHWKIALPDWVKDQRIR